MSSTERTPLFSANPPPYSVRGGENHRDNPSTSYWQPHLPVDSESNMPDNPDSKGAHGYNFFPYLVVFLVGYLVGGSSFSRRQDLEWKQKADLCWIDATPESKCLSYEKRMYTAKLAHIPDHTPGDEWCWNVPIKIHGDEYAQPEWCGIRDGEVYGQWYVDKNEPSCSTWFSILDKESTCVHGVSHTRRYFGKLENFNREDWDNWRIMCATTPFKVHNLTFERPHQCGLRPSSWVGAWGTVDVHDETCPV
ncbi:hypothetical protein DL96DRAFT_1626258 [Flagelloscypha sp. PMI_526]|nr:hypothetical protein DL96DRAFT_1626258 [Flagelloscypha sp. PMI_526]